MIEVELRGPMTEQTYADFKDYLTLHGRFLGEERRFIVAYSDGSPGGIKDPLTDVRLRMTNGKLELIVKKGSTLKAQREEQAILLRNEDMQGAMRLLALMGYTEGLVAYRHIERYTLDDVEFALQSVHVCDGRPVPSAETLHSHFYEAELLCSEGEQDATLDHLRHVLDNLGLEVHTYDTWNAYMDVMNTEANMDYDYHSHGVPSFFMP